MNAAIEETVKNFPIYLDFQATQPKVKTMPHEILGRLWESVRTDIFSINNRHYLCIEVPQQIPSHKAGGRH